MPPGVLTAKPSPSPVTFTCCLRRVKVAWIVWSLETFDATNVHIPVDVHVHTPPAGCRTEPVAAAAASVTVSPENAIPSQAAPAPQLMPGGSTPALDFTAPAPFPPLTTCSAVT